MPSQIDCQADYCARKEASVFWPCRLPERTLSADDSLDVTAG